MWEDGKGLPPNSFWRKTLQVSRPETYGDGEVFILMSVFSVLVDVAGDGFMIVVLLSFFSAGGFVTVVSFCSQPASNARPASIQMYFFILI
jgi:hypothetical protein